MSSIIIYASKYGSTERYARELSKMTGVTCINYKDVKRHNDYDKVVYMGGIFGGNVLGLSKVSDKIKNASKLIVATIGIGEVDNERSLKGRNESIERALSAKQYASCVKVHLRGAIDYAKLTRTHSLLMKMFYKMLSRKDEHSPDAKVVIDTYGKSVDYVDYVKLGPIKEALLGE